MAWILKGLSFLQQLQQAEAVSLSAFHNITNNRQKQYSWLIIISNIHMQC